MCNNTDCALYTACNSLEITAAKWQEDIAPPMHNRGEDEKAKLRKRKREDCFEPKKLPSATGALSGVLDASIPPVPTRARTMLTLVHSA